MPRRMFLLGSLLASLVFCPSVPHAQNLRGAIWGTVIDANGEPLTGWSVKAYWVSPGGAIRSLDWGEAASNLTDQQGRYVIDVLEPGEYVVGAVRDPRARYVEPSAYHSQESAPYPLVSVRLRGGEQVRGIVIRVVPRPRIFGTVTTATGTPLLPEAKNGSGFPTLVGEIYLTATRRPGVIRLKDRTVTPDTNGRFQFDDVFPGEYVLTAQIKENLPCAHCVQVLSHESVAQTIAVSGDDVGPLRLTTTIDVPLFRLR